MHLATAFTLQGLPLSLEMASVPGLYITVESGSEIVSDDYCVVNTNVREQRNAALALLTMRESSSRTPVNGHNPSLDHIISSPTNFSIRSRPSTPHLRVPSSQLAHTPDVISSRPHPLRSHPTHSPSARTATTSNRYYSCYSDLSDNMSYTPSSSPDSSTAFDFSIDPSSHNPISTLNFSDDIRDRPPPTGMLEILVELRSLQLRLKSIQKSILQISPTAMDVYLEQVLVNSQSTMPPNGSQSEDRRVGESTQRRRGWMNNSWI